MVVHATSPKPFPLPLARAAVAPLQMRNFNVETPSSLWTFHHAVPSPSFSSWELSKQQTNVRVCVYPWNHRHPFGLFLLWIFTAGECGVIVGPRSTKLPQSRDTESDQLGVPASF